MEREICEGDIIKCDFGDGIKEGIVKDVMGFRDVVFGSGDNEMRYHLSYLLDKYLITIIKK
jgi:hypothetical protein